MDTPNSYNIRSTIAIALAMIMAAPIVVPGIEAAPTATLPGETGCNLTTESNNRPTGWYSLGRPANRYADDCFHQFMVNEPDTADIQVLIVPPQGQFAARDLNLVYQSIDMMEWGLRDGANLYGMDWFYEGFNIDVTIWDEDTPLSKSPDIIVIQQNAPWPFGYAFAGQGSDRPWPGCNPFSVGFSSVDDIRNHPDFNDHHGQGWGTYDAECENGERICTVVSANVAAIEQRWGARNYYDLHSHEFGHCLGLGHTGDASDFAAKMYPPDDIMSYESDPHDPDYELCISNLNVKTAAYIYSDLIPGAPDVGYGELGNGYIVMEGGSNPAPNNNNFQNPWAPSSWRIIGQDGKEYESAANCYAPSMSNNVLPGDTPYKNGGPAGEPEITVSAPADGEPVAAGDVIITGDVDRLAGGGGTEDLGTRLGTDASDDTTTTGCPAATPCDGNNINPVRPGLDLTAAYVNEVGGDIRFTFEVADASAIFNTYSGDPDEGAVGGGYIFDVGLNAAFMTPGGATTETGVGYDVSVSVERGESTLTPGFDRKGQVIVVGSLSGGVLSQGLVSGDAGIDLENNRIWVDFSPEENAEFLGAMEAIRVRSQYTIQGSGSNSVITVDTLDNVEETTFGDLAAVPLGAERQSATPRTAPTTTPDPEDVDLFIADALGDVVVCTPMSEPIPNDPGTIPPIEYGDQYCPSETADPAKDIEAVWFEQDEDFVYIGMKLGDIPADVSSTISNLYSVEFTPSWSTNWVMPEGNTFNNLRVAALYSGVDLNSADLVEEGHNFELQVMSSSTGGGNFGEKAALADSSIDAESDIIWWVVPIADLADQAGVGPSAGDALTGIVAVNGDGFLGVLTLPVTKDTASDDGAEFGFASHELFATATIPTSAHTDAAVAVAVSPSSGSGSYTCTWSATGPDTAAFADAASCGSTTVTFPAAGSYDVGVTVDDGPDQVDLSQTVTVTDAPADDERVDFYIGQTRIGSASVDTSGSATASWSGTADFSDHAGQTVTLTVQWIDNDQSVLDETELSLTVEDAQVEGTVAITSHADGDAVTEGTHTFAGTATRGTTNALSGGITEDDQTGVEGATLHFSSTVTGGDAPYTCTWSDDGGATISNQDCDGADFVFDTAGDHTVTFRVEDDAGAVVSDTATAHVTATDALSVDAGSDATGDVETDIDLVATVSGGTPPYTCAWTVQSSPAGSAPSIDDAGACSTTFAGDVGGDYVLRVDASDDAEGTASDTTTVTLEDGGDHSVTITSPSDAASDVEAPVVVTGRVTGLEGGAAQQRAAFDYSRVDPDTLRSLGLVWEPWMSGLAPTLAEAEGLLAALPEATETGKVLTLAFLGDAPASVEALRAPADWTLQIVEDVERRQLKEPVPEGYVFDVVDADSLAANGPNGVVYNEFIGPGSHLLMSFDGSDYGSWLCTANWVWNDQDGNLYLGSAGHCFLPQDKTATHGEGSDFEVDPDQLRVYVCKSTCPLGGYAGTIDGGFVEDQFGVGPEYVELGPVSYARQNTASGADVGHDFGLVAIPEELHPYVNTVQPVWGGSGGSIDDPADGDHFFLHGNAAQYGETFATKSRPGIYWDALFGLQSDDSGAWNAITPSYGGDSGSAVGGLPAGALDRLPAGVDAVGILTHGYGVNDCVVGVVGAPCVGLVGASLNIAEGTLNGRAIEMAKEAGLCIEPLLGAVDPETAPPAADCGLGGGGLFLSIDGGARTAISDFDGSLFASEPLSLLPGTYEVEVTLTDGAGDLASATTTFDVVAPTGSTLTNGQPYPLVLDETKQAFTFDVPAGAQDLAVTLANGNGIDGDLAVRFGQEAAWDDVAFVESQTEDEFCYSAGGGDGPESCSWADPSAGTWHVSVYAFEGSGDTWLMATWDEPAQQQSISGIGTTSGTVRGAASPTTQSYGPTSGSAASESIELYVDGVLAGSEDIDTSDGSASWSIDADVVGAGDHEIAVEWYAGTDLVDEQVITVSVDARPTAAAGDDQSVDEGATVTLDGTCDDEVSLVSCTWTHVSGPEPADWTDGATDPATFTAPEVTEATAIVFELTAEDSAGQTASDQVTITVQDVPNVAPTFEPIEDVTIMAGNIVAIDAVVEDADGDVLSYILDVAPAGATWADARFEWTPDNGDIGTHDVTLRVSDGEADASRSFQITVEENPDLCTPPQGDGDQDGDGIQDSCDDDRDGDGFSNRWEERYGSDPDDPDSHRDLDGDGHSDGVDNCPDQPNADQADQDADGLGDACDLDRDGDTYGNQREDDAGSDPDDPTSRPDWDGDGVHDKADNCIYTENADQVDSDGDGRGDACDGYP